MTPTMLLYTAYDISSIVIRLIMLCYIPQKHAPSAATAWLLAIYFWPWPGFLLYSMFGSASLPEKRVEDALARQRRLKERFLATPRATRQTTQAWRSIVGSGEHQAIAAEMAQFL